MNEELTTIGQEDVGEVPAEPQPGEETQPMEPGDLPEAPSELPEDPPPGMTPDDAPPDSPPVPAPDTTPPGEETHEAGDEPGED